MEALLKFLDLTWEERVLDFTATARTRHIRTPSYAQVTQPLHKSAAGGIDIKP